MLFPVGIKSNICNSNILKACAWFVRSQPTLPVKGKGMKWKIFFRCGTDSSCALSLLFWGGNVTPFPWRKPHSQSSSKKERKKDDFDIATSVNCGVSTFSSWSESICNPETGNTIIRGPEDYLSPFENEHLEQARTSHRRLTSEFPWAPG